MRHRFEPAPQKAPDAQWNDWRWQQRARIRTLEGLAAYITPTEDEARAFRESSDRFEMAITPYYAALMGEPGCPVRLQSVPQMAELDTATDEFADPLAEERFMPVPGLTHRYPDRVLLYTTHNCPVYCRHCTRKRKVSAPESAPDFDQLEVGCQYIEKHPEVRDVIVSGGDPLTLSDERLDALLKRLRGIPHVEIIRLGTRNLVTLPQRVTDDLCRILREYAPIYVQTHFNHPKECTREAFDACARLADHGLVISNQMVLMKGINDDAETVKRLNHLLLLMRVRPYYILQADPAEGTRHFRTPIQTGIDIIEKLRGHTSGLAIPHFVVDCPGGGGKVSLVPKYLQSTEGKKHTFRNYRGDLYEYFDP